MNKASTTTKRALAAAVISHIFWGLSFMASRLALDRAPVILLLSHRFLLAFVLMSLLRFTPLGVCRLRGKALLPLILLGLVEPVVYFFGEQYGILHSSTIFSGVMIALIPIASTLAAIPILGEKPTLRQLLYSMLSVGGVIGIGLITNSSGSLDWIGVVGLLVAVFSAMTYTLLSRGISARYSPFERSYCMFAVGALVFTVLALISVRGDAAAYLRPLADRAYLLSVLFLAVCCSVICYVLSGYVLTWLTVARATVFANLTTAVSVFAGAIFLHEPFSIFGLLCCAMILFGIYGVQRASAPELRPRQNDGESGRT
ncbi:MAG: DMT family transporter [Oscillospiraceae bacterium]|nr:DMT family transporter [Oscillospiraceae bacterium]